MVKKLIVEESNSNVGLDSKKCDYPRWKSYSI